MLSPMTTTTTHYQQGAPTNHFLGLCDECDAHYLARMTLNEVDNWYRQGVIGQDTFEGYCHGWATSCVRGESFDGWLEPPVTQRARDIAAAITKLAAR